MAPTSALNLLTANARTLQTLLQEGSVSSVSLVDAYIAHIKKHDDYLHAMIELTPLDMLRARASAMDKERKGGQLRGPLHGIPIIIKDNIATHSSLGLRSTAGSLALFDSRPKRNAKIVDLLLAAGVIIIGKTNLSEWSNIRGRMLPSGWSAVGGQTQSAYVRGGIDPHDTSDGHSSPSGSSSGSAVGVSAGYAPISIGTETDGSLTWPSSRAALYTLKPTIGLVSQAGIIPVAPSMDSAGPMTKTVYDLAITLDAITELPGNKSFTSNLTRSWRDISVGTVDTNSWTSPASTLKPVPGATVQINKEVKEAYQKIESLAKRFVQNVPLIAHSKIVLSGEHSERVIMLAELKKALNAYLEDLESSTVRSLEEVIAFNEKHAEAELPPHHSNQDTMIKAQRQNLTKKEFDAHFQNMRKLAKTDGIDYILDKYDVDVIIGPSDGSLPSMASCAGYPVAQMPLGYLDFNGRPYGLSVVARAGQDDLLIRVLSAWEATFPPRIPPPMLERGFSSARL